MRSAKNVSRNVGSDGNRNSWVETVAWGVSALSLKEALFCDPKFAVSVTLACGAAVNSWAGQDTQDVLGARVNMHAPTTLAGGRVKEPKTVCSPPRTSPIAGPFES